MMIPAKLADVRPSQRLNGAWLFPVGIMDAYRARADRPPSRLLYDSLVPH